MLLAGLAGGAWFPAYGQAQPAAAQTAQQALVDRATLAVQDLMTNSNSADPRSILRSARAVMICPRVFKAGFILGASGGGCVLVARDGSGSWSDPAFYDMGSGSIGLQIGIQDSAIVMMIMTDRGLSAVMDSQFKLGADAGIAIATIGAGVEGATTAALRADIVAFAISRGLFGGVSLQGSLLSTDTADNQAYYGQPLAARQIVVQMQANNPGADPLREMLTRYGGAPPAVLPPSAVAAGTPPAAPYTAGAPTPLAPVQQQALPAPQR
jgi:lipid-binding SYLF domain-containing protein